ncbi:Non-catalytic module family expn, partial [Rhizoctonia solani]
MFSRFLFFVLAMLVVATVIAESNLPVALDAVDTVSHRASSIKASHKRGPKSAPKGRGGRATWYEPGQGHCGGRNKNTDMVVALPGVVYSGGKYCGKKVKITNPTNGQTCYATVVDSCPGYLSPSAFKKISKSLDDGVATINWDVGYPYIFSLDTSDFLFRYSLLRLVTPKFSFRHILHPTIVVMLTPPVTMALHRNWQWVPRMTHSIAFRQP